MIKLCSYKFYRIWKYRAFYRHGKEMEEADYVDAIAEIRNFKGITDWRLSFKQGFNLIKGENGKGKTSILEVLAARLGGYLSSIDGANTRHFKNKEIKK